MIRYFLLVIFAFTSSSKALAQDSFALIDSAAEAFNNKDTGRTIHYLESYLYACPDSWLLWMAGLRLVDFYKQQGRYDSAIARLNYVIKLSSVYNSKYYPTKQSAASLLRFSGTTKLQTMRSDVFVELSDLYRRQNDPEKALACLEKADSCYMRFSSDCGNWLIQCLTQLSLKYADFYLSRGDTTSAINRLLKFCFWQEPYSKEATVRLRGLLLSRYTALAISRELKRGVAYIYGKKKKKDPDSGETIHFTLFGYQYQWIPFSTAEELRKFLAWSPNFKLLRDGETANIAVGK